MSRDKPFLTFYFSLADTLLDDFLLTYPVFMSTGDLCQALLEQYPYKRK